jgi:hypothetical protein
MSEDNLSLLCKVDKRSTKKIDSIKTKVSDFCLKNKREAPNTYFDKNVLVVEMCFFESDLFDGIKQLLCELVEFSKSNPVAKYELDTAGETFFYSVTNNEMREFNKLKNAFNTKFTEYIPEPLKLVEMGIDPNKISLVKLSYTDSKKASILDLLKSSLISDREANDINGNNWCGEIKELAPYTKFVSDRGGSVIIGIDAFDTELLPNYPSDEEIAEEIATNKKRNKDITETHIKDMRKLGIEPEKNYSCDAFTTNKHICRKELREEKLVASVETLLGSCLEIQGVTNGSTAFRHRLLPKNEEVYSTGSGNDGVYIFGREEMSDINNWIKN